MTAIHPALLPRNVSKLRSSFQPFARRAMAARSWIVFSPAMLAQLTGEEALGMLPVIYATLDPSFIPSPEILDVLPVTDPPTPVPAAEHSMAAISFLSSISSNPLFPRDTFVNLWPRVWQWARFLQLYSDCSATAARADAFYRPVCGILRDFTQHSPTQQIITKTSDIRQVFCTSWKVLVQGFGLDDPSTRLSAIGSCLRGLAIIIRTMKSTTDGDQLSEVLEGCDGSLEVFSSIVIQTVSLCGKHSHTPGSLSSFAGVLMLLDHIYTESPDTLDYMRYGGIISALVSSLDITAVQSSPHPLGLTTLLQLLSASPGYPWVLEAVRAGFLDHVVSTGVRIGSGQVPDLDHFLGLLGTVLPLSLVSCRVVVAMKEAFSRLEAQTRHVNFTRSTLYAKWNDLKALVHERARVLEVWEASGRESFLGCYNLKCDKVDKKQKFRRCSVCNTAAYCSRECQRVDWIDGHRDDCLVFLRGHCEFSSIGLTYRETSFLHALVAADYQRLRLGILRDMITFISTNPNTQFYLCFDYTGSGAVQLTISPLPQLDTPHPHPARVARSGGLLVMHIIRIPHGTPKGTPRSSYMMWPLRATNSRLYEGLVHIARMVGGGLGDAEMRSRLLHLIRETEKDGDYRECHL
ncbi:hypothetical protein FB45DRAFT_444818 [Roridomyces roridus]|uniref:MYND-type domain-containing protein n=1 Tax=Roridomyces roridus TaxID=1738132 RepID=A0AAD7FS32_9AGAR|nr:hypothetical protein FB45DRAFT_444818 [Roridomyces roridus]